MPVDKKLLRSKIDASKREVSEAEEHLTKVLRDTDNKPRAEKTTVTLAVREALAKLRAARKDLEEIDALVSED